MMDEEKKLPEVGIEETSQESPPNDESTQPKATRKKSVSTTANKKLGLDTDFDTEEITVDKGFDLTEDELEVEVPFDFSTHLEEEAASQNEIGDEAPKKVARPVDLSKINVVVKDAIAKEGDLKQALFGNKMAFQIVAAQSGYMCKISPLVNKDIVAMLDTNVSRYEYRKGLYKVIYDKIVAISSFKMTFEEWLKYTSAEDIETFYYGLYSATFPNEGTFVFQCPNCGKEETIKINAKSLFKTTDQAKMKKLISDVSKYSRSKEEMLKFSLLDKTESYELPDSSIIAELRTPSLWDSLEIFRVVPDRVIDRDRYSATSMLYIKRLLVPSRNGEGKLVYTEISERQDILRAIDNMTLDDASILNSSVSDRVGNNRIGYSIKNLKCVSCGKETQDIPLSLEDVLFALIFEKLQS